MKRKINISLLGILLALMASSASWAENPVGISVVNKTMASYTAPANVVLTNSGQNTSANYMSRYILVNNSTGLIAYSNTSPVFSGVPVGNYSAYAVNYNSQQALPTLTVGTAFSAIGGDCVNTSVAFPVIVTTGATACSTATAGVGIISAVATGQNTTVGFTTTYVLTNATGVIQSSNTTGSFNTPGSIGEYRIYAVNYSTTGILPNLANGNNIASMGGDCVDVSDTPKCFNVTAGSVTCINVSGLASISATASGQNTGIGFTTRYIMTNASGVILNSNTSGSFTAPNSAGEVRIYAVNYNTAGIQPVFTNGINISAIGGDCVDISDIPKCFTVTPSSVTCTNAIAGSTISATVSGNNTSAGFITTYVLTNASGVIQSSNSTGSFTAPVTTGEYRVYAVNYAISGIAPTLTSGTNISTIGGDCVDLSDNYKCFNVQNCPPPTVSVQGGSPSTICTGESTILVAQGCTGTITWFANGIQSGQSGNTITVNPATNTSYTATCTTVGCGTTSQSTQPAVVTVTQPVTPANVTASQLNIALGQSTMLQATCSSGTPIWRNSQGTIVTNPVTPISAGANLYTVACGQGACFPTGSVSIQVCPNPQNNCLTAKVTRVK